MNTESSLQRQHSEITAVIDEYVSFVVGLASRVSLKHVLVPKSWRQLLIHPLGLDAKTKAAIARTATDGEKASPLYGVLMADDQSAAFSSLLLARFPDVNFCKVRDYHQLLEPKVSSFNFGSVLGIALAMVGGTLQSISNSTKSEKTQVTTLDRIAFYTFMVTLLYALSILIPRWLRHAREKEVHRFTDFVIAYTCIEVEPDR